MYLILDNCQGNPGWADAMAKILGKHLPEDKVLYVYMYQYIYM